MVLEITEIPKMIVQQNGYEFVLGYLLLRILMLLFPLFVGVVCCFLVSSVSKFLQNSSNMQNISVTLEYLC